MNINRILFTSDLSEGSKKVFQYAASLADQCDAGLVITHVLQEVSDSMRGMLGGILSEKQLAELHDKHGQDAMTTLVGKSRERSVVLDGLEMFCEETAKGMKECKVATDEIVIGSGHAAEEIVKIAKDKECDVIVMGTHNRGLIAEAMVGSVVRGVLRRTSVPVLVVPLSED